MRLVLLSLLSACTHEYAVDPVLLDGEPLDGLEAAVAAAQPGSVIELDGGRYVGGLVLPDGVTILGNGSTIAGGPRVITGEGALTLRDLHLEGGDDPEGSAIRADALVLRDVDVTQATGDVAIWTDGSIDAVRVQVDHTGTAIHAQSPLGRARLVQLTQVETDGDLWVEADDGLLVDVEAVQLTAGGPRTRLERVTATGLSMRGRSAQLYDTQVDLLAAITVDTISFDGLYGASWTVSADQITGLGTDLEQITLTGITVSVGEIRASRFDAEGEQVSAVGVDADVVQLTAASLTTADVVTNQALLDGPGTHEDLRALGASPTVHLIGGSLRAGLVVSDDGPSTVELWQAEATNLLVVEPPGTVDDVAVHAAGYGYITNGTLVLGQRTALTSPNIPVQYSNTVIVGRQLGDIVDRNTWIASVAWSETEALPPRLGLTIEDPLLLGPGDPELNPLSPWVGIGAFAGPYGALVLERWRAL